MSKVLHDVFPAFVAVATGDDQTPRDDLRSSPPTKGTYQIVMARVVVTDSEVLVAKDGPTGPIIVFRQPYTFGNHYKNPSKKLDSYLTLDNGQTIAYRKDENCGCGSRLRSWNPYNISNSSKDPSA